MKYKDINAWLEFLPSQDKDIYVVLADREVAGDLRKSSGQWIFHVENPRMFLEREILGIAAKIKELKALSE